MSLFDILTGRIYRYNKLIRSVNRVFGARFEELQKETGDNPEIVIIANAYAIADKIAFSIFDEKRAFGKSAFSLTQESLEKIYCLLIDVTALLITSMFLKVDREMIAAYLARLTGLTVDEKNEDIANYNKEGFGVGKLYGIICSFLNEEGDAQHCLAFNADFKMIYERETDILMKGVVDEIMKGVTSG